MKKPTKILLAFSYFLKILYQVTQCKKRDKIKILESDWNVLSYLRLFCKIKLVSCEQI